MSTISFDLKKFIPSILFGKNDFFKPLAGCGVLNYKLAIFNRWGEKGFETSDPRLGWDGFYQEAQLDYRSVYVVCGIFHSQRRCFEK